MKKLLMLVIAVYTPAWAGAWTGNYARWRGDRAYTKQDFTQASSWYEKALAQNPQDAQALYCWAKVAYKQKAFEKAEQAFDKVVQEIGLNPVQKEQALSSLADTAMQLHNYQKAVDNYTQALALNHTSNTLKKKLEHARLLLAQQKQERESAQDKHRQGNSDNTADNNERQQGGQQDKTQDNQSKSTQEQSTGAQHSTNQSQQSPHDAKNTTHKSKYESKREREQECRNQQTTEQNTADKQKQGDTHNTEHSKLAQDKKQDTQYNTPTTQSHSQYKQKESQEQQLARNAHSNQVPEQYRQVVEAIAQEDQHTLTRLLARAVSKEQKRQDYTHDKNTHGKNW